MASGFSPAAPGGPPPLSMCKIVLLGRAGAGKDRVVRVILKDTKLHEESEECFLYEGEHSERRICIVDTPGWDRVSIECTTNKIINEIPQSVMLCPPGPHALILVLPVISADTPSVNELNSASQHMELLSERVWNHTMVLFLCDGDLEESTVREHIQKAEKLLEKCRGRHYVMRQSDPETQVQGLLKEIDSMVEENHGDCFIPQVYYEVIQNKIQQGIKVLEKRYEDREEVLKQAYHKRLSVYKQEAEEEPMLKQRRGSIQGSRPTLNEDEKQEVDIDDIKTKYRDELQALARHYLRPVSLLVLAVIGALIGSVVGSNYGVVGSGVGIVIGILITIPVALYLINATSVARQSSVLVKERKSECSE